VQTSLFAILLGSFIRRRIMKDFKVSEKFTVCKINRYEEILHLVRETHWKTGIMKGHWKIERQAT